MISQQEYEITVTLKLPRTPHNLAAGNFMVDLALLASSRDEAPLNSIAQTISMANASSSILARSRRPGILTYVSKIVDTASTMATLPWYVLGLGKESETLEIVMFEGVQFAKGTANVPNTLLMTIEADEKMQIYEASVRTVARFGGLRWILYHHRILSFLIFSSMFWSSTMISMLLVWAALGMSRTAAFDDDGLGTKEERGRSREAVNSEPTDSDVFDPTFMEDLSDTSRSFPTLGRQMPLHFVGEKKTDPDIKTEEDLTSMFPTAAQEADDEDEDNARLGSEWRDSGIGTSREEERQNEPRMRRSKFSEMGGS